MTTLYDITAEWQRLQDLIMEHGGDCEHPDVQAALASLEGDLEVQLQEKVEGYCKVIREMEADADKFKREMERLGDRKRAIENATKQMKQRLRERLEAIGQTKVKAGTFAVSVRPAGGKPGVDVMLPPALLPERFQRVKVEPDIEVIREAINLGEPIDFAVIRERGMTLSIR
jgi:chromosome segregation ATPase